MPRKLSQAVLNERKNKYLLGFHWCTNCLQYLEIAEFPKGHNSRPDFGLYAHCKSCHSNRRKGNSRYSKKMRNYNRELKSYYKSKMGGECAKCGYNKTQSALEFHHVTPKDKESDLARLINSNKHDQIMFEIDKCVLLCRNCHMELEACCWECEFTKEDKLGWGIKPNTIVEHQEEYWTNPSDKILYSQQTLFERV